MPGFLNFAQNVDLTGLDDENLEFAFEALTPEEFDELVADLDSAIEDARELKDNMQFILRIARFALERAATGGLF